MKVFIKSENIKEMLVRRNLSQNSLAYKLSISSGYISQLMDGSRCPSPKLRERIMKVFPKRSFDDLFEIEK